MENSCHKAVEFDEDGFPLVPHREGHGLGLKSIAAVAEKYHGLFQCDCNEGVFTLHMVLPNAVSEPRPSHPVRAALTGVFLFCFLLNCMPTLTQAPEAVPVLGPVVRMADLRSYSLTWGGGSVEYSRYITLNQQTGQVLTLSDLFQPESNYVFPISREIKTQMAEQMKTGEASYFLPGSIWPDEDCFQSIETDQNFYINGSDQLVIVFEEYEVAPGSMGTPEFVIPTDMLDGLLIQPSILK